MGTPAPSSLGDMVDPAGGPPRCPFKERHAAPTAWRFVGRLASALTPSGDRLSCRELPCSVTPLHGVAHLAAGGPKSGHVGSTWGPFWFQSSCGWGQPRLLSDLLGSTSPSVHFCFLPVV